MSKPKTISPTLHLQAFALFTMAHQHYMKARDFEQQMAEMLGYKDIYAGCLSDQLYGEGDFNNALKLEGFVVDQPKPKKAPTKRRGR